MSERVASHIAARIARLIDAIIGAGGWGSVTIVVERGRVARLIWSVDEKVTEPNS